MQNKIITLGIPYEYNEINDAIYLTVLIDENEIVLVDCGYPGFLEKIEDALLNYGINPSSITKVVITHHDYDHIGALCELKAKYPDIQILASNIEAKYIEGEITSLRLQQALLL